MSEERKEPGVLACGVVTIVALLLYVLSAAPANWLLYRGYLTGWIVSVVSAIYWPLSWLLANGPEPVSRALRWYVDSFL